MTSQSYPTYGYSQKELRYLYVDAKIRVFEGVDGNIYLIHDDGPQSPLRRDQSGFWLELLEDYL